MKEKDVLTKILAVAGTVLAWFPILAPVLLTTFVYIRDNEFHFDYLMPAELFLSALLGAALLMWAAKRAGSRLKLIAWAFGIAVVSLFGGQELAVVTGLASGEIEPEGIWYVLSLGLFVVVYSLALIVVAVGGILLVRDIWRKQG